jgi:hypothetical protein
MAAIERRLDEEAAQDVAVQRYQTVPGVGLLTATALRAGAGDLSRFRSGRHLAAWLGLVPREHSSGQQRRLGKITKRGDGYLRTLLIHGGRAVLRSALLRRRAGRDGSAASWALDLQRRQGHNRPRSHWPTSSRGCGPSTPAPFDPQHPAACLFHCQECTTIRFMTKGSVPGLGKADDNSGSRSRFER